MHNSNAMYDFPQKIRTPSVSEADTMFTAPRRQGKAYNSLDFIILVITRFCLHLMPKQRLVTQPLTAV
jgi:hypothetical protein